jgi:hypothetical protein
VNDDDDDVLVSVIAVSTGDSAGTKRNDRDMRLDDTEDDSNDADFDVDVDVDDEDDDDDDDEDDSSDVDDDHDGTAVRNSASRLMKYFSIGIQSLLPPVALICIFRRRIEMHRRIEFIHHRFSLNSSISLCSKGQRSREMRIFRPSAAHVDHSIVILLSISRVMGMFPTPSLKK